MNREVIKQALIHELQTVASYSDQRLADKLDVSRETVRLARHDFQNDSITYLGKNFIDFKVNKLMAQLSRLERNWDQLEKLKNQTSEKAVKAVGQTTNGIPYNYVDIVYTKPTVSQITSIIKQQSKLDEQINKLLVSGILKVTNITHGRKSDKTPFE